MDDLLVAVGTTEEANEIYYQSKEILSAANTNVRKWCSNDSNVTRCFSEGREPACNNKKVLGLNWHTITDELSVELQAILGSHDPVTTKRNVLQTTAKIFDPIGILGPLTTRAKILLQKMWKQNLKWDEALPDDLKHEWQTWCAEVKLCQNLYFPDVCQVVLEMKSTCIFLRMLARTHTELSSI